MEKEILSKLKKIIATNARINIEESDITEDTLLVEDLEYDSLKFINLIIELEEEFSIEFSNTEMLVNNVNSLNKILNYIMVQIQEREDGRE